MGSVFLYNPTFIELDDAYRRLPRLGEVVLKTSNCNQAIHDLEKIGFVAIEIITHDSEDLDGSIRAFKGKHGPCRFTGRQARYSGAALAALDDDNHLLFVGKDTIICEKTYNILSLAPYGKLIECQKDTKVKDQKISISEEELDDFESAQSYLISQLKNQSHSSEHRNEYIYPGPFKLLILQDGTIVRRGKWSAIPLSMTDELIRHDGLRKLKSDQKGVLSFFQDEYATYGSACLLGDFKLENIDSQAYETDFSTLGLLSDTFKGRLLNLIDDHKKYFVLIGNDAQDQFGCCPSEEVSEANRLVRNGILSALAEPIQGDSCPVTVYAFKDEISAQENVLASNINTDFRKQVRKYLHPVTPSKWKLMLKWVLLAFITVSLILAAKKCDTLQQVSKGNSIPEQLNPAKKKQIQLILFHNKKRCFQCLQIEKYSLDVLNDIFSEKLSDESLKFKPMIIDDAENLPIVDHFGIFSATLVLLDFNKNELVKSKVLMEVTASYREEKIFKAKLKNEVEQFLKRADE